MTHLLNYASKTPELLHTGDRKADGLMLHGVNVLPNLTEKKLFAVAQTGYNQRAFRKFQAEQPTLCIVDTEGKTVHVVMLPLSPTQIGETVNHAVVAVFRRKGETIEWYVLPVPETASRVNTGNESVETSRCRDSAYRIAGRAFSQAESSISLSGTEVELPVGILVEEKGQFTLLR